MRVSFTILKAANNKTFFVVPLEKHHQTTNSLTCMSAPPARSAYLAHFAALCAHGGDQHVDLRNEVRLPGVLELLRVVAVTYE
jgi:hypothetical protein